jgi:hypothetical protein
VIAAGAIALASARLGVPSATFWSDHPNWIMAALFVTIFVPVGQAAAIELGERGRRKKLEKEQKVQTLLASSLIYLATHAGASWEQTGVQAFVLRGRWRFQRHERLTKFRLRAITTSGVAWTKGKGAIGRCWETRQPVYADLDLEFEDFTDLSKEEFDALPADSRYGLTYEDFQKVKGKYGVVAAVPMIDQRDRYIGCVTADMPPGTDDQRPLEQEVLKSLALTAQSIAQVL